MKIPIDQIIPNPQQPRLQFGQVELRELADSMQQNGLLQPILVEGREEHDSGNPYVLVDGERRWRAARLLGWTEIDANVRPASNGGGERERTVLALVANLQRANLSKLEQARAFEKLAGMGYSNNAIGHMLGISYATVANRRTLLLLDEAIQDLMDADLLPSDARVVDALLGLPGEARVEFARKLSRPGLKISVAVSAIGRFQAGLSAKRAGGEPAMQYAHQRAGKPDLARWDMLRQLGQVPPWQQVAAAANHTCKTCVLREEASAVVCSNCPAVVMLANLIELSKAQSVSNNGHR